MWTSKLSVKCPVCKTFLGKLIPDRKCSFPCVECQWIFPFDIDGKALAPTKLNPKKQQICDCEGCRYRDEQDAIRLIRKL